MAKYSCPVCEQDLAPGGYRRILDRGKSVRGPYGLPIERRRCSECGESLEREPLGHWLIEGSLVPTGELAPELSAA